MSGKHWKDQELIILKKYYSEGSKVVKKKLPNRTLNSIRSMASSLKLKAKTSKGYCRVCNIKLSNDNWYMTSQIRFDYICKKCIVKINEERRRKNYERHKKYQTENCLHTNNKTYIVKKRPRPKDQSCELCGRKQNTVYHHYGKIEKGKLLAGIWVCRYCHYFVERYDQGYAPKYENIKRAIINECSIS